MNADMQANDMMQYANQSARLLQKVSKKSKALTKFLQTEKKNWRAAYEQVWVTLYQTVPDNVFECTPSCQGISSLATTKSTILSGTDKQLAAVNRLINKIKKATKDKKTVAKAKGILKRAKDTYSSMRKLINTIPDTSFSSKC